MKHWIQTSKLRAWHHVLSISFPKLLLRLHPMKLEDLRCLCSAIWKVWALSFHVMVFDAQITGTTSTEHPATFVSPLWQVPQQFHHFSPLRENKSRVFTKDPHKSTHHGVCMPLEKDFCILGTNIETLRKHWHPLTICTAKYHTPVVARSNRDTRLGCQRQFQSQWTVFTGNKHLRRRTHGLPTLNINWFLSFLLEGPSPPIKIECSNILPNFDLIRLQVYAPKVLANIYIVKCCLLLSNPSIPEYPWQW